MLDSMPMPEAPWFPGDDSRERLLEAARLASVGRLVPAVAHQLATPLASIALRAESLEGDLGGPGAAVPRDKLERYLRAISAETAALQRAAGRRSGSSPALPTPRSGRWT